MTEPVNPSSLDDPRDAAAFWFARERSGRMDTAEYLQFEAWLRRDPQHELEYKRAKALWNTVGVIPERRLRLLMQDAQASVNTRQFSQRRGLLVGAGVMAATVATVGLGVSWFAAGHVLYQAEFATLQGERQQVTLPDGSVIELNTATSLSVQLFEHRRVVTLHSGEAYFTVSSDQQRPFFVEAAQTSIRVTGTRFDVRLLDEQVKVAVESGSVKVDHGPWWSRNTMDLRANQGVDAQPGERLEMINNTEVTSLMAWTQGRLVFSDTPLAEAIAEVNRYAVTPIRFNARDLMGIRIAGSFSTQDSDAFFELLPEISPVNIGYATDGVRVVTKK